MRRLREALGLNLDEAAELAQRSRAALGKLEQGVVALPPRDIEFILIKYGVIDPNVTRALLSLAKHGRKQEWLQDHADLLIPEAADFLILESDAVEISSFASILLPGLLQTPDFARTLMTSQLGPIRDLERSVAFRMQRQRILTEERPARLHAILGESVIRQRLGGREVLKAQLIHLNEISKRANVTIQVMPHSAEVHPGVDGPFTLLTLDGGLPVAFLESLDRSLFLEADEWTASYGKVFDALRGVALSEADSRSLIEQVAAEL